MGGRGRRNWDAFEQFCNQEHARILDAVTVIAGDADLAQEAVNEALARAWNRVQRGHPLDSLAGWVRVVAINLARDHHRRRAVERRRLADLVSLQTAPSSDTWGVSIDVRAALAALPSRQREVAVLFYFFDLTVADTARELGISVGTVKTCLERARASLRETLGTRADELVGHDAD